MSVITNHEFGLTVADARRLAKKVRKIQISIDSDTHWREDFASLSLSRAAFLNSIAYTDAERLLPSRLWSNGNDPELHLVIGSFFYTQHEQMLAARKAAQAMPAIAERPIETVKQGAAA